MDLLEYVLGYVACIGVIYGVTTSTLAMPVRVMISATPRIGGFAEALVYCPYCVGFWAGVLLGQLRGLDPLRVALTGFEVVGVVVLLHAVSRNTVFTRTELESDLIDEVRKE